MEFTSLGSFVVAEGNSRAFSLVKNAADRPDGPPCNAVIEGPAGSGKSHLLRGAALDCKLLWASKILYVPSAEIRLALTLMEYGTSDEFFGKIGSCGLLLLDDADDLLADEVESELLGLLLKERSRLELGTILSSTQSFSFKKLGDSDEYADGFEFVDIKPLEDTAHARKERLSSLLGLYPKGSIPEFDERALRIVCDEFVKSHGEVWAAARFLAEGTGIEPGGFVGDREVRGLFN